MSPSDDPTSGDDPIAALSAELYQSARVLLPARDVAATLHQVLILTKATIEACDYAGVVLLDGDTLLAPSHTNALVSDLDALYERYGEGPCFDAIAQNVTEVSTSIPTIRRRSV
jgi:hypothetical protein